MTTETDHNTLVLDQFTKQAESFAALANRGKDPSLPMLLKVLNPLSSDRMLDVGCGTGSFAVMLAPLVGSIVGIDLTEEMLRQAQKLQTEAGVTNIEWRQGDVTLLPFADGEFSIVTSRAMLHHVIDPARVIAEMHRVCARDGRIVVIDLSPKPDKVAALDAIEILRDPSHVHALTLSELRHIGSELGLEEIAINEYEGRIPLEWVLQTSFPEAVTRDRLSELYRIDAKSGVNAFGLQARIENGETAIAYPMSTLVWKKSG